MNPDHRRRSLDWALVVGVASLAIGAAIHAVSTSSADRRAASVAAVRLDARERGGLAARLAHAGVHGTLIVGDAKCRLAALPLPSLEPVRDLELTACSPAVSPPNPSHSAWFVWRRPELLVARCAGRGIEVAAPRGASVRFVLGCAPAWRPDGTLTYVRRGEATRFPATGRAELVLARHELVNAFGAERRPRLRELAWATDDRFGALVQLDGGAAAALAVSVHGRLTRTRDVPPGSSSLAVSPDSEAAVVLERSSGRPFLVTGGTRTISLGAPALSAAWSPDGRWLALARARHLDLVEVGGSHRIRLPVAIETVAWR